MGGQGQCIAKCQFLGKNANQKKTQSEAWTAETFPVFPGAKKWPVVQQILFTALSYYEWEM